MKTKLLLGLTITLFMTGCSVIFWADEEGWRPSQKDEFLEILKDDKYMSICNQKSLYEKVKSTRDSKLMTKLLVGYTYNLANSCIDLQAFKASQDAKKEQKIETYFATYQDDIEKKIIKNRLSSGQTIEEILHPYVPQSPQFQALIKKYRTLQSSKSKIKKSRLKKIRLNIERSKLMKQKLGNNYILINIPEFKVRTIEDGNTTLKFNVIVGKPNMQTPIFSEKLTYVEINPQWNVPDSIMRKSYISKIKANPDWIKAEGMELHKESYDLHSPKVNPTSVDWSKYLKNDKEEIPYKLVQVPSRKNGLGRVKFIFPNSHAVYMHDTQSKSLFSKKNRCFSHGCIRLAKPKALLNHITTRYTTKDLETVRKWYNSLKTKHLILNKDLQVHTAYYTAYVDKSDTLHIFPDIYGFDKSQKLNFSL